MEVEVVLPDRSVYGIEKDNLGVAPLVVLYNLVPLLYDYGE